MRQTAETLSLVVTRIRELTSRIRAYELQSVNGNELSIITAGSHLIIPISEKGKQEFRRYSICSNPNQRDFYEIAVANESSDNISQHIYNTFSVGTQFQCAIPENNFHVHANSSPAILIADEIGITPIISIAHTLAARGRRFTLHYTGQQKADMAFADELQQLFPRQIYFYTTDDGKDVDIKLILSEATSNTQFYACGPQTLLDEVTQHARSLNIPNDQIQLQHFDRVVQKNDKPVVLELAYTNKLLKVSAEQPLLAALRDAKIPVKFDCCIGDCGTCAVKILEGEAEHRDHILSDAQKAEGYICVCVSRSKTEKLVLAI